MTRKQGQIQVKRGGSRPGAGRKPRGSGARKPLQIRLAPEVHEYLETVESKTAAIESAILATRAYRTWKRSRHTN